MFTDKQNKKIFTKIGKYIQINKKIHFKSKTSVIAYNADRNKNIALHFRYYHYCYKTIIFILIISMLMFLLYPIITDIYTILSSLQIASLLF